jgi:hypothetical protein
LRDFNVLLTGHNRRIECAGHLKEVSLITVITPSDARIHTISEMQNVPGVPPYHITNTHDLRRLFGSSKTRQQDLLDLKSEWAGCTQELVQTVCLASAHLHSFILYRETGVGPGGMP